MENMRRELTVASVSWINETPNPISLAAEATLYDPEWVPKTYLGLVATANGDPGDNIADLPGFQKSKNFRAMTYCRIAFEESPSGISAFQVIDAFHDPGFTPPFKMRNWPSTLLSFDRSVYSFAWYAGEASLLSKVYTQSRHANTTLPALGAGEIVLVNGIIKFRAGMHTDSIGVNTVGCPYHVPWVWCETLLSWNSGKLKLYGHGSIFPSHAWYIDGKRVAISKQVADASFPKRMFVPPSMPRIPGMPAIFNMTNPFAIAVEQLTLYPVLSAGASAAGPQVALDADIGLTTPVDKHPHAGPGAQPVMV
jgi:hypothetical protein